MSVIADPPGQAIAVLGPPIDEVVQELVAILGGPNVAVIGAVGRTSAVAEWMRGTQKPKSDDRALRLRLGLRLALIIKQRFRDDTVRAWFHSANELLDDEAPIALLADRVFHDVQKPLILAARAFIQG